MTKLATIALSALELPSVAEGDVPEWIHLVPRGEFRAAHDGRGPWRYRDADQLIKTSFAARKKIHIDLNHSTGTAAKAGFDAPAVGYVTEMEEREDGIWGKVDWTYRDNWRVAVGARWEDYRQVAVEWDPWGKGGCRGSLMKSRGYSPTQVVSMFDAHIEDSM